MTQFLLPTNDEFIESIAKAIAKNRLYRDASLAISDMTKMSIDSVPALESAFDVGFEELWNGNSPKDQLQKNYYREDARVAISAINLKLLTSTD